jgi:hypothetical protein
MTEMYFYSNAATLNQNRSILKYKYKYISAETNAKTIRSFSFRLTD